MERTPVTPLPMPRSSRSWLNCNTIMILLVTGGWLMTRYSDDVVSTYKAVIDAWPFASTEEPLKEMQVLVPPSLEEKPIQFILPPPPGFPPGYGPAYGPAPYLPPPAIYYSPYQHWINIGPASGYPGYYPYGPLYVRPHDHVTFHNHDNHHHRLRYTADTVQEINLSPGAEHSFTISDSNPHQVIQSLDSPDRVSVTLVVE